MGSSNSVGDGGAATPASSDTYWRAVDRYAPMSTSSAALPGQFGYSYGSPNCRGQPQYTTSSSSQGTFAGHMPYVSPARSDHQFQGVDFGTRGRPTPVELPLRSPTFQSSGSFSGRDGHMPTASFHAQGHDASLEQQQFRTPVHAFTAQSVDSVVGRQLQSAGVGELAYRPTAMPPSSAAAGSPVKPNTLLIFDWDDTLMCSSAFNANQFSPHQYVQLEGLVEQVLTTSMCLGETCIVTNADELWVMESTRRFLPRVLPLLSQMRVMSARMKYEHLCPGDVFAWKRETFREVLAARQAHAATFGGTNLVVLGDSLAEMEAAHTSTKGLLTPWAVKTVKFKETPSVDELLEQLQIVNQELATIVADEKSGCRNLAQVMRPCIGLQLDGVPGYQHSRAFAYTTLPSNTVAQLQAFQP